MIRNILLILSSTTSILFAEPSDEAIQAATALIETTELKKQLEEGYKVSLPLIEQQAKNIKLSPELTEEYLQVFIDWYVKDIDHGSLLSKIIPIYAEAFTIEELKELEAFYQTPLGKKTLKALPHITTEITKLSTEEAQSKQHIYIEKLQPILEKIGK